MNIETNIVGFILPVLSTLIHLSSMKPHQIQKNSSTPFYPLNPALFLPARLKRFGMNPHN